MISQDSFEQDLKLKRFARTPREEKPRFAWDSPLSNRLEGDTAEPLLARIRVRDGSTEREIDTHEIADAVGCALTDLLLSRNEEDIFNDSNRTLVAQISQSVAKEILRNTEAGITGEEPTILDAREIAVITERVLVQHNAFDVAKSFLLRRRYRLDAGGDSGDQTPVVRVIRRNGEVVTWNPTKVEMAVRRAFLELEFDPAPATDVARSLTAHMIDTDVEFIHIEDLQDRVQEELMRQGHFKVAEAFILFRSHRAQLRSNEADAIDGEIPAETDAGNQRTLVLVKQADGSSDLWDGEDLRKRVAFASLDLDLCLSPEEIENELRRSVFEEMTASDLRETVIMNAKSLIEKDADFSRFAGRILVSYIYEEVLGWDILRDGVTQLTALHRKAFKRQLQRGVDLGRINPRLLEYDLDALASALDPAADLEFDYLGMRTLYDRYLIIDKGGDDHKRLETPQLFWMRVAMGLFVDAPEDLAIGRIKDLYRLYKSRRFCSSTPTLFNSGTQHSQLSSCYLYKVDDSIESIMQRGISENAYLSKWAGGLGGSWTAVRGTGSYIQGTNGESQGIVPFLKLHNDQLVAVNQGGKRKGSGCAYLETWHNDILDFLELRKGTGDERRRCHDMNTANWIPDLFMKRMEAREQWTLFRSNEVPDLHDLYGKAFETRYLQYEAMADAGEITGKRMPAIDLWKEMLRMIFETGHPWITFKDPCNVRSPQDHAGVIHSSNLCTEITLNTSEEETAVCNLGSVVLDNHLDDKGEIDHEKLKETISIAVRALDNVIDINFYPTEAARTANQRHRPIGLGVMGLQNALFQRGQAFASEAAVEFNDEFMEAICYYAYEASSDLAKEQGSYPSFKGSKWDRGLMPLDTLEMLEQERDLPIDVPRGHKLDWDKLSKKIKKQGMRNSNIVAIAPTATISNIMGSSPCIEPTYKNLFVKSNLSGDFIVLNAFLVRDLKKAGLWSADMADKLKYHDGELAEIPEIPDELKERYATAFGVEWEWLIAAAARRQKWIDQSQSVNLFLPEPDLKSLSHMYRAAWRSGLKTTYYLRTLGASGIEKSTVDAANHQKAAPQEMAEPTDAEKQACAMDALINGGECESCQ